MSQTGADSVRKSRSIGRAAVAVLMIVSLAATALTRQRAMDYRVTATNGGRLESSVASGSQSSSLSAMPSYATALLLGGLRGPLVMILWTTSETQKQQHDIQDFDTMVEWIRLLQPEFDTVHLFQIWNKAYNVSVLMSDQSNKYTTILDAIDYGQRVDRERPDDINILSVIAMIYGDKLGTSQEHPFYRRQVRKETQTRIRLSFPESESREKEFRAAAAKFGWNDVDSPINTNEKSRTQSVMLEVPTADAIKPLFHGSDVTYQPEGRPKVQENDPGWRRLRLDPMLDINGNILPELLTPRFPRPANIEQGKPWYDGSQLQFLAQYQPFPYGLSSLALAYNDYKRAQLLQTQWGERHIQSGDAVVDTQPAITLKNWAKDEWERGRHAELRMWGQPPVINADLGDLEAPMESAPVDLRIADPVARDMAVYSYKLAARVFRDSHAEYSQHIISYPYTSQVYQVHIDDTINGEHLMTADADYILAGMAAGAERARLIDEAALEYSAAARHAALTILKYYVAEDVVKKTYPINPATHQQYNRANIMDSNPRLWGQLLKNVDKVNQATYVDEKGQYNPSFDQMHEDRANYANQIDRCNHRFAQLQAAAAAPTTSPASNANQR